MCVCCDCGVFHSMHKPLITYSMSVLIKRRDYSALLQFAEMKELNTAEKESP